MPNAKVLESKKAIVDQLADRIGKATAVVFVDYKGITVAQDTELRNKFREAGVEYAVVKNTLTRLALDSLGVRHVYYESPGTGHEWLTWRRSLHQFAPMLFK